MLYFAHPKRQPKRRNCPVIRLLTAESHEIYCAASTEYMKDVPLINQYEADIFSILFLHNN